MKKIAVITLFLSVLLATNCFAVTFNWIEVISDNRVEGWKFSTDLLVPSYSPSYNASFSVDGGPPNTMTYLHWGTNHVFDSGPIGELPTYDYRKTFSWNITDKYDSSSISATATIPNWAYQMPLSTDVVVSGDPDPSHLTVSWNNVAGSWPAAFFNKYFLGVVLASDPTKLLWKTDTDIPRSVSVTYSIPYIFEPGVGYLLRVEARNYWYFTVSGTGLEDMIVKINGQPQAAFLNRSAVFVNYVYPKIDIKPGSVPNSINLKSKGIVPVAILTTDGFDATMVDPDTVQFAGASPERWTMCDVDDDGDQDMLFHFRTQDLDLDEYSTEASLTCYVDGEVFEGRDSVRIVPAPKKK